MARTKLRDGKMDHLLDILLVTDIGANGDRASLSEQRCDLLDSSSRALVIDIGANDLSTLRGKEDRGFEANSTISC